RAGPRHVTARTKAVPQCVFMLPRAQLLVFLRTLFTCDGAVFVSQTGLVGISYSTISRALAQDVQHLLLRFGFIAMLRTKPMRPGSEACAAHEVQLLGAYQVSRFLREIGLQGCDEAMAEMMAVGEPALRATHCAALPTGARYWSYLD